MSQTTVGAKNQQSSAGWKKVQIIATGQILDMVPAVAAAMIAGGTATEVRQADQERGRNVATGASPAWITIRILATGQVIGMLAAVARRMLAAGLAVEVTAVKPAALHPEISGRREGRARIPYLLLEEPRRGLLDRVKNSIVGFIQ